MAVSLEAAKQYLKLDADIFEDDELIEGLIEGANEYIEQCTGKRNDDSKLYDLCIKLLVAHWFENRATLNTKPGTWEEMPHAVTALLKHISLASHYPPVQEGSDGS